MIQILNVEQDEQLHEIERLAKIIWTEHYTPIIGSDQVMYMLDKYQSVATMQEQLKDGYQYFLVLNDQNESCGYLSVQPREDGKVLFLSKIYVLSTCRGKGIGKKMMEYVVGLAKSINAEKIRLTVNKYNSGSIAAYHKMGFETVDSVNTDIGKGYFMDDYVLELPTNQ